MINLAALAAHDAIDDEPESMAHAAE